MAYALKFHPRALQEWRALDPAVREALKAKLARRLEQPHVPAARLHGDLANCYKIRHDATGHRLVYEVFDDTVIVLVLAVSRRTRLEAYVQAARRRT